MPSLQTPSTNRIKEGKEVLKALGGAAQTAGHRRSAHGGPAPAPVCRRMCTLRLPDVEKLFRQYWHLKALMPVCVLMCAVRVLFTAKARKHCGHLKGFSCV